MKKIVAILVFFTFFNCSENAETYVPFVEGYWAIDQVKKDNKILKEYNISSTIDYFKINDDLTGYRKKVMPKLDGTFTITEHEIPLFLYIKNNTLYIEYINDTDTLRETIVHASEKILTITNADGFTYIYKPFEKFNF